MNGARPVERVGRGRALPLEHYQAVAEVYLEAFEEPGPGERNPATNVAVAETWDVPITTAARWVKRAKELGLLDDRPRRCSCRCPVHCPNA